MFTGIIESMGILEEIKTTGTNCTLWIKSQLSDQLKIDQSISHNGVCLTVEEVKDGVHCVTAIDETLKKTNLGRLVPGSRLNLERCLSVNGRLDGHLVQGHVDTTATTRSVTDKHGSWEYSFSFPESFAPLIIDKGSICLNGISLTVFDVTADSFSVAIIPYTFKHTNLSDLKSGDLVNLEFDMIGKYITRSLSLSERLKAR
ncbi:MAG: riboflavin synthase [Chitinophagaceae bacterium]